MPVAPSYRSFIHGQWRLAVLPGYWTQDLQDRVLNLVERQIPSKHPQTLTLLYHGSGPGRLAYVKVFHRSQGIASLKDSFRESKAFRSLRQCIALARAGFDVPTTVAAGEFRRFRLLLRAFAVTVEISGQPAPDFLRERYPVNSRGLSLAIKRDSLKRLAEQIRHFHRLGFVHGDLVPSNICISAMEGAGLRFYFMDNDRTRRYPCWLPQSLWKRNLVQLNRFPLPGISLQDRMRFFRCYLGYGKLRSVDRRLLRWLEKKTRQRRKECDAVDPNVDFRKLMRWEEKAARGF
jgi:serine/threonine protein kinase